MIPYACKRCKWKGNCEEEARRFWNDRKEWIKIKQKYRKPYILRGSLDLIGKKKLDCKWLQKNLKKSYVAQRELTVGREIEYDNSSVWPDEPEHKTDPDVLSRQVRKIGVRRTEAMRYQSVHDTEDDYDHTGPGLRGKHTQATAAAAVNWQVAASYWKIGEVKFEYLTQIENKCLTYSHNDGLSVAEIAQRVRRSKSAVNSILARARKKIRLKYSKGGGVSKKKRTKKRGSILNG